jgi:mRNA-degrading endonuclease toxin of MazEF toxin-antitoxin module
VRGDVHRVRFIGQGHEQHGERYAVVVQASSLAALSTTLVCPTSTRARPAILHPTVAWDAEGTTTQVLVEQMRAVDYDVLGPQVAHLLYEDMSRVSEALRIVLDL